MYVSYSNDIIDNFEKTIKLSNKLEARLKNNNQHNLLDELSDQFDGINQMSLSIKAIKNAVKFKLEHCHNLLPLDKPPLDTLKEFVDCINLPFPYICIELDALTLGAVEDSPLVLFAEQEDDCIRIFSFFKINGEWIYNHYKTKDNLVYVKINRIDFQAYTHGVDDVDPDFHELHDHMSHWLNNVTVRAVANLLCALSCSNTRIDDCPIKPSPTKNAMRRSKNKLPLFQFKVLTIDSGKNASNQQSSITGSHSSPRIHLRRGHIRKLTNKNVWVNACVVGDKTKGVIHKDYIVK